MKRPGVWLGIAVGVVYVFTAPGHLLGGDSAEFVTLSAVSGVAHPPGYPLYVLWLRLWHTLLGGLIAPPRLAALATVPFGVGAVVILYATALRHGASVGAALLGAVVFALSPLAWRLGCQPEVFAPHVFLCGVVLWFAADARPSLAPAMRIFAVSVVGGAALSIHHTAVLVAPAGIAALWGPIRRLNNKWLAPLLIVAGGTVGLLPYLTLFGQEGEIWPRIDTWGDLARHFLRSEYGTFRLSSMDEGAHPLIQLQAFAARLARETLILPLILLVFARGWWMASFVLAGPVFVSVLNIAPYGTGQLFVPRFYLLPLWLLCLGIAIGARRLPKPEWAAASMAALLLVTGWKQVRAELRPSLDDWMRNAMQVLPKGAVVLADSDNRIFALQYARRVEHLDAEVIPAYRADAEAIVKQEERPVFLTLGAAISLMGKVPLVPHVPFFKVVKEPPNLEAITRTNHERFAHFQLDKSDDRAQTWANLIMLDYSESWIWLARRWKRQGNEPQVLACLEEVGKLGEWFVEAAVEKTLSP